MAISTSFEERLGEVVEYVEFIEMVSRQVQEGQGKVGGGAVTDRHQKMLYSSVYLQIYNLVEATAMACVEAVCSATVGTHKPVDLSPQLRREWVKRFARTHAEMHPDHRLERTLAMLEFVISADVLGEWPPATGGGGNWDDQAIEVVADRMGFDLRIEGDILRGVKRRVRDDKGLLRLVRDLRNDLAHGSVSFVECAGEVTPEILRSYVVGAGAYLREVVRAFETGIRGGSHLAPSVPQGAV